jgi:hypothetical protein
MEGDAGLLALVADGPWPAGGGPCARHSNVCSRG